MAVISSIKGEYISLLKPLACANKIVAFGLPFVLPRNDRKMCLGSIVFGSIYSLALIELSRMQGAFFQIFGYFSPVQTSLYQSV